MPQRAAIYVRISVSNEESVSIARQIEACTKYAEARGWSVAQVFADDGVSATSNKPQNRAGWRALMDSPERFERVVVWKVDRLARRTYDFLSTHEALKERGAFLVAVDDLIDMSTAQGEGFATMLAVFGQMEAAAISARVKAARAYLIKAGRVAGGAAPYGWQNIENPDGPGMVLAQDVGRIGWVQGMVERALRGDTIYSICRWLDAEGAPLPTSSQVARKRGEWNYRTVQRILRHPILAGMSPHNPGHTDKERGAEVLRDNNGMPVVDESLAILSTEARRTLLSVLDDRDTPQRRPRASRGATNSLLSRLVVCGHCDDRTMSRGTNQGRPVLQCKGCHHEISRAQLDPFIIDKLLTERGDQRIRFVSDETEDNSAELADIEDAIRDVTGKLSEDNANTTALIDQLDALKALRATARAGEGKRHQIIRVTDHTVRADWEAAEDDLARREVLAREVVHIRVVRGGKGRYLDRNRVEIRWRDDSEGPLTLAG